MAVHHSGTWVGLSTKSFKIETLVPQHRVLIGAYLTAALLWWRQRPEQSSLHTSPFSSYVSGKFCLVLRFLKKNNKMQTLSRSKFFLILLLTRQQFLKCQHIYIIWKSVSEKQLKITDRDTFSVFVCSLLLERCIPRGVGKKYFLKFIELALSSKFLKKLLLSMGFFFSPRGVSVFHERTCPIWIKLVLPLPVGPDGESLCVLL